MVKALQNMGIAYKRGLDGLSSPKWAPKNSIVYKCWLKGKKQRKMYNRNHNGNNFLNRD